MRDTKKYDMSQWSLEEPSEGFNRGQIKERLVRRLVSVPTYLDSEGVKGLLVSFVQGEILWMKCHDSSREIWTGVDCSYPCANLE